jgi:hypothetical protein
MKKNGAFLKKQAGQFMLVMFSRVGVNFNIVTVSLFTVHMYESVKCESVSLSISSETFE